MIIALTYISLISGGLLVLILLVGILGGLDFDVDFDLDSSTQADGGVGVGIVKGGLTFLSVGSWVVKLLLLASANPVVAIVSGVGAGAVAVYLLSFLVNWLLSYEENVNWSPEDALMQSGQVYLRIPDAGEGIVTVNVKGGMRELRARSSTGTSIPTGVSVFVDDFTSEGILLVSPTEKLDPTAT
ncbi:hypothetical protein GGR28_001189 [Lewinella aquimaris]|uniref:NfeD-like C-terminal domain-containing protein n=1 Tax=Neolewinella aquimaris TaxID=1835722 RepID=A0A840EC74_9BACT|nr:hypothetical protein [Neolewinella aquimaris]MBB4078576.1 hypothetical protein [Neolewinella aquimaris]